MERDAQPGRVNLRGQRTCWCFTLNNPQNYDIDDKKLGDMIDREDRVRYYVFQLEKSESGTKHYQGK